MITRTARTVSSSSRLTLAAAATGLTAVLAVSAVSLAGPAIAAGPPDPDLGRSGQFSVLADEGVTNTGATTVVGLVGSGPTKTTVTGSSTITPPGNVRQGVDGDVTGGKADLLVAYGQATAAPTSTTVSVGDIGGRTIVGGTYTKSGSLGFTGTLTLDGENNPSSTFIIQVAADFTVANNAEVLLTRGAQACHVYWRIGNNVVVGTDARFKGNILAGNDISAKTRAAFQGRLLSNDGAITLDTNTFTNPTCTAATTPPPTSASPTTPTPTNKPTPKPTKKPSKDRDKGGDSGDDRGSSGGGSDDSGSGSGTGNGGDGDGSGSGSASGVGSGSGSTSTSGLPDAGGPAGYLAPLGAATVLAGAGLVVASRRRSSGAHRA